MQTEPVVHTQSHFFPAGLPKKKLTTPPTPSSHTCLDDTAWFWGATNSLSKLRHDVGIAAKHCVHSLIVGETGSGKEVVAREIHRQRCLHLGRSFDHTPFVAVNCGAIPETLAESILFGHERGAFTSARDRQIGKFEQAHDGTIFLDEIQNLPLTLQSKLLRVLQFGELDRLGSKKATHVSCKIIAASNVPLENLVARGTFRKDLYYRLNIFPLIIPPLHARALDIPLLAQKLLRKLCRQFKMPEPSMSKEYVDGLIDHSWPGNLRELEHALLYSTLKGGSVLNASDLPPAVSKYTPSIQ